MASSLNIGCSRKYILALFQEVDLNNDGTLSMDEFKQFLRRLLHRPEIEVRLLHAVFKMERSLNKILVTSLSDLTEIR